MKKGLVCFLAALMLLATTACGGDEDVRGTIGGGESTENENPSQSTTASTSGTQTTTTGKPEEEKFGFGTTAGGEYTNRYIGIGCKLDDNWTFKSDEEILAQNNLTKDYLDEDIAELLDNSQIIYDMMAVHSNGTDNLLVNLEKTTMLQAALTDLKAMLERTAPTAESALSGMGYTNFTWKVEEVTIGGQKFAALRNRAEINGVTMYQLTVAVRCSQHIASIGVTTFGEDKTDDLLAKFYLVE